MEDSNVEMCAVTMLVNDEKLLKRFETGKIGEAYKKAITEGNAESLIKKIFFHWFKEQTAKLTDEQLEYVGLKDFDERSLWYCFEVNFKHEALRTAIILWLDQEGEFEELVIRVMNSVLIYSTLALMYNEFANILKEAEKYISPRETGFKVRFGNFYGGVSGNRNNGVLN